MNFLYIGLSVVAGLVVGWLLNAVRQHVGKSSAEIVVGQMKADASKEAEHILREAKVSAKAEILKMREDCEQELKERRKEQQTIEKRLSQREEVLERKMDNLDSNIINIEKQES